MPRDTVEAALDAYAAEQFNLGAASRDAEVTGLAEEVAALKAKYEPPAMPALAEDFADLAAFSVYNGAGAYSQQGVRLDDNAAVAGGILTVSCRPVIAKTAIGGHTLAVGDYAAGGVMHRAIRGPGTRYTMQLRMDASQGTRAVALLWPYQMGWPEGGELDFTECGADLADRHSTAITNHWYDPSKVSDTNKNGNAQKVIHFTHDFTQWTDVEVLWQPGLFVVTIDGTEAARYTEHVPTNQMKLAFQTAVAGGGQAPTFKGAPRTPGCIQVRALRIYDA